MQVQWFPGHMHRGRKQIKENLKKVDIVLEILDARAPLSSRNPLLGELIKHKKSIVLLNKTDLADKYITKQWIKALQGENIKVIPISAKNKKSLQQISTTCRNIFSDARWFHRRPVRALILGIPNVGKSTIINSLAKNKKAAVANSPGFTKDVVRYDAGKVLQIYDSPGILWPKFEDPITGLTLACLGSIRDTILPIEQVVSFFLDRIIEYYPDKLTERYTIDTNSDDLIDVIGKKRGAILPGGIVDREKTAMIILRDYREGRLGSLSVERPN